MQTKIESLIESSANVASGFFVSLVTWQIVAPLFGYDITFFENIQLTSIFTVVSVVRGYIWRRFFNRRIRKRYDL